MFSRIRMTTTALGALALGASLSMTPVMAQDSTDPIKLTLHDWTGQLITTQIMGEVLKKAGDNVEYVQADYLAQFAGLESGDLHVAMEMWETTGRDAMDAATATGKVENFGPTGMKAKEEWWFPEYMKEKCPGLPNWEALKDPKCAEAFSTPETAPNGRYLGGPVTWEGFDDERVVSLGLPFTVIHAGTDAAMFAELDSAYQRQAPIMLWIYSPHWAPAKYKGEWVEFPEYTPECYTDPKWGSNPDAQYDCGKPHGEIYKYAWGGMKDKWPVAYKVAKNYTIDTEVLNGLSGEVDLDGKAPEDVAAAWIAANEATWKKWAE
ncbi:MAG: ABC transporter substrate-binding protein [Rhizobiaceae bacterium]|nr:ABC transporter substrate-binding protein [Rhizobiaceae bacterium]